MTGLSWLSEESNHVPSEKSGRTLLPFSGDKLLGWLGSKILLYAELQVFISYRAFAWLSMRVRIELTEGVLR